MPVHDMRIVCVQADGKVAIIVPVRDIGVDEADVDYFASLATAAPTGTVSTHVIPVTALPHDPMAKLPVEDVGDGSPGYIPHPDPHRAWRGCWRWNAVSETIEVDEPARKLTQWDRVREVRNKLLEKTDIARMVAAERGRPTTDIDTYRQALRDLPSAQSDPDNVTWPARPPA